MATFAAKGTEVFPNISAKNLHRKRSHGRLKAYASCEDVRAWSNVPSVRQRHLIDVINAARTGYGNYIPILELLKLLGVPTTGVVLAEALKKLNKISEILGETDFQHPSPTSSELEFKELFYKRTGRCLEDDTVRNLRCLVAQLYERSKDFEEVKCERDRLRCWERAKDDEHCNRLLHLETERNCLQERLKVLEGIESRMASFMEKYEASVKINRELRKELAKVASNARVELSEMQEKECLMESEKDSLLNEIKLLRRKVNILEKDSDDLIKETSELRFAVADQEDEIDHLTSCINKISYANCCRMEQLQYALDQFQQQISDDLLEKVADQVEMVPVEEFVEKVTELRDKLRNILRELKETSGCPDSLSSCQESRPSVDDRTRCNYLNEALDSTRSKLRVLLNYQDEAIRSRKELSNCYKKLEACEELQKEFIIIQKDNEHLKNNLIEMENDFRNLNNKHRELGDELFRKTADLAKAEESIAKTSLLLNKCDKMESEMAELEKMAERASEADNLEKLLEECTSNLEMQSKKLLDAEAELRFLRDRAVAADELTNSLRQMEEELLDVKEKLDAAKEEIDFKDTNLKDCSEKIKSLKESIEVFEDAEKKCKDIITARNNDQEKFRNIIHELDDCMTERKKESEGLNNQINDSNVKINDLTKEISDKTLKITACSEEINRLNNEIVSLRSLLKDCQEGKIEAEHALSNLEETRKQLERQLALSKEHNEQLQIQTDELKNEIIECNNNITNAQEKMRYCEKDLENALNTIENSKREKAMQDEESVKILIELRDLVIINEALAKEKDTLFKENNIQRNEAEAARKLWSEYKDHNEGLQAKLDQNEMCFKNQTDELKKQKLKLEEQFLEGNSQLMKLEMDIKTFIAKDNLLENKLNRLTEEAENYKKEAYACQQELQTVKSQRDHEKEVAEKLRNAFGNLEEINKACQMTMENLKRQKDNAEKELASKIAELSQVEPERLKILDDLEELKKKYDECSESLRDSLQVNETLKNQCLQDMDECEKLKKELSKTKWLLQDLEHKFIDLRNMLQAELDEDQKRQEETNKLKNLLQGTQNVREALEKKLDECTENSKIINAELDKAKFDLKNLEAGNEQNKDVINKLKVELDQCKDDKEEDLENVEALKTKLKELDEEMAKLAEKCTATQNELNRVNAAYEDTVKKCQKAEEQIKEDSKRIIVFEVSIQELNRTSGNAIKEKDRLAEKLTEELDKLCELTLANNELRQEVSKLVKEKEDLDLQLKMMINDKGHLQKEFDELQQQLSLLKKDLNKIKKKDEKKDKEIEDYRKKMEEKDGIINGLKIQFTQSDQEIENVNSKNKNLIVESNKTKNMLQRLKVEKDNLVSSIKALGTKLEKMEDIIQGLTSENIRLNTTINKKEDEIKTQKAMISKLNDRLKEKDHQLKDRNQLLEDCLKTNKGLNLDLEKRTNNVKKLESDLNDSNKALSTREKEVNFLTNTINDLDYKLQAGDIARQQLEDDSAALRRETLHLKNDLSKCNQSLKETSLLLSDAELAIKGLQIEKETLLDRLRKININMIDLENALENLEMKNTSLQNQFDQLTTDFDNLNHNYTQQSKDHNNLNEQYIMLKQELLTTQNKLDTCEAANNKLKNVKEKLEEMLQLTKSQFDDINEQNKLINHQLDTSNQLLDDCQTSKKKKEEEIEALRKSFNKVTLELELKLSSLVACQKDAENLKLLVAQLERNGFVLKETVSKVGEENEELIHEIKSLKNQVTKLEAANSNLKTSITEKDAIIFELNRKISENEEAAEGYKMAFENSENMLKKCTEERNKVRKEVESLQQQIKGLEKIRNIFEDEINNCKTAGRKLSIEMDKIKSDYETLLESKQELINELVISKASTNSLTESLKKIKEILNQVQKEKDIAEDSLRMLANDNSRYIEELDNAKRKLTDAEYLLNTFQSKLKNEIIENDAKQNRIKCLQNEVKLITGKLTASDKELVETKMERDNLISEIVQLKEDLQHMKDELPANTPINNILNRIMKNGFEVCKLTELSELHEAVIEGTEAVIRSGRGQLAPPTRVFSVEPKPRPMTEEAKKFVLNLAPLQKQLAQSQHLAKKRSCALMENVQNYQHELNALRAWDVEFCNRLKKDEPIEDSTALQLRASQYQQSKLAHLIATSCKKQKETVHQLQHLSKALDKIETAQNQAVNNQLSEQAVKIAECMKRKLDEAEENERTLMCLLHQERLRSVCLENTLRTRQSTQMSPETEVMRSAPAVAETKKQPSISSNKMALSSKICPPFPWMESKSLRNNAKQQGTSLSKQLQNTRKDCSDKKRSVSFSEEVETKVIDSESVCS